MIPALLHGLSLGEYDWLSSFGLLQHPGVAVHNGFGGDQIGEMIPWTSLAWTQVHHGQLPLWNPYNALGMPLAFNWQSAAFSLPNLIGYLFPLHLMYTVQVMVTLFIAGTGAYVLGRVLGLSVLACALAGTVFELSGPFFVWVGWPIASVVSWSGWLFAATFLIIRGRHQVRDIALFSIAFAFAIYAGEPDTLILIALTLVTFAVVLLAFRVKRGLLEVMIPLRNLVIAGVAGVFLGAPLLLPGLQLISKSIRNTQGSALNAQSALSLKYLLRTAFPWIVGTPLVHEYKYIGIIAVVLALLGVAFRLRRPEVAALSAVAVVTGLLVFDPGAIHLVNRLPELHAVRLPRALNFFAFAIAMLSGVGLHVFVRSRTNARVLRFVAAGFGAAAVALLLFWLLDSNLSTKRAKAIRSNGFTWLLIGVLTGIAVVALEMAITRIRARGATERTTTDKATDTTGLRGLFGRYGLRAWTGLVLLAVETIFLAISGAGLWTSSSTPFAPTHQVVALQRAVGSSLVALGAPQCFFPPGLGIPVNDNINFGVHQLAVYDPMVPRAYYIAWQQSTGTSAGQPIVSHYCPGVTSATLAREYGVGFILEPHGAPGPTGAHYDTRIGDEDLYRVTGAGQAVLLSMPSSGAFPPDTATGRPVAVTHPNPASWRLTTNSTTPQVLRLHLTNLPGWRATIDGRPLTLKQYSIIMFQARIPAGRHLIELNYLPSSFTEGVELAAVAALGLIVAGTVAVVRRRTQRRSSDLSPRGTTE
jgi:hypothetical protein